MANRNGEKGTRWERELAAYLDSPRITRKGDHNDLGDLGDPDWCIEAKNDVSHTIPAFIRQMLASRERAGKRFGVVLLKGRRTGVADSFAIMPIWLWRDVRDRLRLLEGREREFHPCPQCTAALSFDPAEWGMVAVCRKCGWTEMEAE